MMIDIFNHFMPQAYLDRLGTLIPGQPALTAFPRLKTLCDVDARRALMDEFPGTRHVLSLANPPPELIGPPDKTPELVRFANDQLAFPDPTGVTDHLFSEDAGARLGPAGGGRHA